MNPADIENKSVRESPVFLCGILLIVFGAVIRAVACTDQFWFDEIWSWAHAQDMQRAEDVIYRLRHDNNHFLNTWFIYFAGNDQHWSVYRMPAFVAGIGTAWLAGIAARPYGRPHAVFAIVLAVFSFPMIQYSSEARGYGLVMFFALGSFVMMQKALARPSWRIELGFSLVAILGMLSHLTYGYCFLSLWLWSSLPRVGQSGRLVMRRWALSFFPATTFFAWLYWVNLQYAEIGGGDLGPLAPAFLQALSLSVGGPVSGVMMSAMALGAVALLGAAIWLGTRGKDWEWAFFLGVVVVLPVFTVVAMQPEFLYPRYFLVAIVFFQLLVAILLGDLFQRGRLARRNGLILLVALLVFNGIGTVRLLQRGRGEYREGVQFIYDQTRSSQALIGTDQLLRNNLVFSYYQLWVEKREAKQFAFCVAESNDWPWPETGVVWWIVHNFDREFDPPKRRQDEYGHPYELARICRYGGLSGWNWAIYRRLGWRRPMP